MFCFFNVGVQNPVFDLKWMCETLGTVYLCLIEWIRKSTYLLEKDTCILLVNCKQKAGHDPGLHDK